MIVFISELFYPEKTSTGYLITEIALALAAEYPVKVITGPATEQSTRISNYPEYEKYRKIEIWRSGGIVLKQDNIFKKAVIFLSREVMIFWKALKVIKQNELIFTVTFSPITPLLGVLLKWIKKAKFIPIVYDLYPEVLIVSGVCKPSSIIVKIIRQINRIVYDQADSIILIGRDMEKKIQSQFSSPVYGKITVIPNWAFHSLIYSYPREQNPILKKLDLDSKFVFLYAGNMGRTHGIEDIITCAKRLNNVPSIHFLISGYGYQKQLLKKLIRSLDLGNITLLEPCPQSQLNDLLNACDVAIISLLPGMNGVSVPSRMYNHMASGKPIIGIVDSSSELAQLIQDFDIGWVIPPNDIDSLVKTMLFAKKNPEICKNKGVSGARISIDQYSFENVINSYKNLIENTYYN